MTSEQELIVHPDATALAAGVAARLITKLLDAQAGGDAHICLTGGRSGYSVLAATVASPACGAVDWSAVHFWWSDERFLPQGHPDRNDTLAQKTFFDHLPVDPAKIHPMPCRSGSDSDNVDEAAASYARALAKAAQIGSPLPVFDVSMFGVGEDAHIASLFPGRTEADEPASVVAVRDSPKPPPTRLTFTMSAILSANEVWLIASGEEKADAVRLTMAGLPQSEAPAGAARGILRTLVLTDRAAAALVL